LDKLPDKFARLYFQAPLVRRSDDTVTGIEKEILSAERSEQEIKPFLHWQHLIHETPPAFESS
jgi:hypothetical protein